MLPELTVSELDMAARAAKEAGNRTLALQQLMEANRLAPDPDREILIRDMRITTSLYGPRTPYQFGQAPTELHYEQGMPTCSLADISPEILRAAIDARGCLYVPNAFDVETTGELRAAVQGAHSALKSENPDPQWYSRPKMPSQQQAVDVAGARSFAHGGGGCLAVDSPRAMFTICDIYERSGVFALAEKFIGESPVLSASKFMLWQLGGGPEAGWHQDGRFLGEGMDIVSINVWTALTDCGESAPGMELVLKNLDHYIQAANDSVFGWAVSNAQVDAMRKDVPVVIPKFRAGDMLLFDHWLLHRTSRAPEMPDIRCAIESWFFAPSVFPLGRSGITV
jgi:Phytanoyl-CoA dioxygenase (PhyH)